MVQSIVARLPKSPDTLPSPADVLKGITTTGQKLPSRVILHGVEGVGKTSFGAFTPKPIFGMARGETGIETLIDSGRVPEIAHFPEWMRWTDVLASIKALTDGDHEYKTLVLDTLNGLERLCHEYVCEREFGGDWGKKGFTAYQQGPRVALSEWRVLLDQLDCLRAARRMTILCLCHTKIETFRNPEGNDYDHYTPELHKETWGLTHKWADAVLFARFYTVLDDSGNRAKGIGGRQRIISTEHTDALDAKNRFGLPEQISMGNSGADAWANFQAALKAAKDGGKS